MPHDRVIRRYRQWYATLLRLYSKPFHERFGEAMEQTFNDLLRSRAAERKGVLGFVLWMFVETSAGIIRENGKLMIAQNKRIIVLTAAIAILLLLPLIAMQFTAEVSWSPFDFVAAGALLFGAAISYEILARMRGNTAYRAGAGIAVATALFLAWSNLAVGIIGSENNAINATYFGVPAVGFIGALIARLQPNGMARALVATALAQISITVVALLLGMHRYPGSSVIEIVALNGLFVALWIGSALLFQRAGRPRLDSATTV